VWHDGAQEGTALAIEDGPHQKRAAVEWLLPVRKVRKDWRMTTTTSNEARTHWAELIDGVRLEPVHITRRGRPVAVVVDPDFYARAVEALEDAEDVAAARAARAEGGPMVTHEELLRELGIEA
jgi:antitoxin StbD